MICSQSSQKYPIPYGHWQNYEFFLQACYSNQLIFVALTFKLEIDIQAGAYIKDLSKNNVIKGWVQFFDPLTPPKFY